MMDKKIQYLDPGIRRDAARLEDFRGTQKLYDEVMKDNLTIHDLIYPKVFGQDQYVGQFSDNSVDELLLMGQTLSLSNKSAVLDIGCGRGCVASLMASRFGWQITGIDLSEIPIKDARTKSEKMPALHMNFIHGNIYDYNFDFLFDGIYGTGAFCHFNAEKLFKHCYQLLNSPGRIAFMERIRLSEIPEKDWEHLTKDWHCPYVYSNEEYKTLLSAAGFTSIEIIDLTNTFRLWQSRSVEVREHLKESIIKLSSLDYYHASLNFAKYENNVTSKGLLGYSLISASKE